MKYPVAIFHEPLRAVEVHHPHRPSVSLHAGPHTPWVVAGSDGSLTSCGEDSYEKMWADYVTGGHVFTELVRATVRDELCSKLT